MPHAPSRRLRSFLLLAALATMGACAAGLPNVEAVDVPRLEQEVAASPDDTGLQVQLGMAQYKAADYEAARASLQSAVDAGDDSGAAFLYLGLVQEELQDWSAARDAYNEYLDRGVSGPAVEEVRKRLTMIGRNLLRAQAQQALAQEQEITATGAITDRSVAVLPMGFNSSREEYEPLVYALSDMMITDFKVSNALVVLERAQIQTLLDEMALTSAGYAEPGTGARAGRLLRAEHVFQGVLTTLGEEDLQTDVDVLNVPSTASAGQLTEAGILEQLFDMEKQVVIRTIREILGVELTPAEEQAILENRMDNVLAFLAYGRGLRQMDLGNYEAAAAEFELAVQLGVGSYVGFPVAQADLQALSSAAAQATDDVALLASQTGETGQPLLAPPPPDRQQTADDEDPDPNRAGDTDPDDQGGGDIERLLDDLSRDVDPNPGDPDLDKGDTTTATAEVPMTVAPTLAVTVGC
jgi:tetratricopeptide (TPR) repeat protein